MRKFQEGSGPVVSWHALKQTLTSIRSALGDIWDVPVRLAQFATADRPPAANYKSGLIYDTDDDLPVVSDGTNWFELAAYDADVAAYAALSTTGLVARTGAGTAATRTLTGPASGLTVTNGDGVAGNPTLALANDLAGLEGLSSTGLAARTGDGTWAARTLTAPAAGISVSNGDGVSGNPTLALANDLAALEALSGTSTIYYRSAADTWSAVTIGGNLGFSAGTLGSSLGTMATQNSNNVSITGGSIALSGVDMIEVTTDRANDFTLSLAQASTHQRWTSGTRTCTIPPNSSVAFDIGDWVILINDASGTTQTIARGVGVTLTWGGADANRSLAAPGWIKLVKVGTDSWYAYGTGIS